TAHVDFQRLVDAAIGLTAMPITPQGTFLEALGIGVRLQQLLHSARDADQAARLRHGVARLTDPDAMGTLFKVLGLHHPKQPPLPGFPGRMP
ncbi:MAG: class I SAM-dependent methyltransferase, partial [Pseudomonadota bacterium]